MPATRSPREPGRAWEAISRPSSLNLALAVVVGVLVAGVAMVAVMREEPTYQSSAVLLLDQPTRVVQGNEGTVVKLSLLRLKYVAILGTRGVLSAAAAEAEVPPGELFASIRPLVPDAAGLTILPAVRSPDPERARRMAQAAAVALSDYVATEQAGVPVDPSLRLTMTIIQDAGPGLKVSPTQQRARQVAAVAWLAGFVLAYVVLQLMTAKRRLPPT